MAGAEVGNILFTHSFMGMRAKNLLYALVAYYTISYLPDFLDSYNFFRHQNSIYWEILHKECIF